MTIDALFRGTTLLLGSVGNRAAIVSVSTTDGRQPGR